MTSTRPATRGEFVSGKLTEKVAIITGSASGIGQATADLFAREGADIALADVNEAGLAKTDALVQTTGRRSLVIPTDVSSDASVAELVSRTLAHFGRIDIVVNVAGVQRSCTIEKYDDAIWDQMMSVNPRSCYLTAKHVVPIMKERGAGGVFVNVASTAAINGGPGQTGYAASKAAIVGFSRSLSNEVAPQGIRVNALSPGWTDTPFNEPAINLMGGREKHDELIARAVPMRRQGTTSEIAEAALFLASDASAFMTGHNLVVSGGE
jgi:NAD(P)-dependent dehydrogenase (short-subunit alcohol dehydrogenase family)